MLKMHETLFENAVQIIFSENFLPCHGSPVERFTKLSFLKRTQKPTTECWLHLYFPPALGHPSMIFLFLCLFGVLMWWEMWKMLLKDCFPTGNWRIEVWRASQIATVKLLKVVVRKAYKLYKMLYMPRMKRLKQTQAEAGYFQTTNKYNPLLQCCLGWNTNFLNWPAVCMTGR